MTQRQQLLELFIQKAARGEDVLLYEMNAPWPTGLGISQYPRCIKELRDGKYGEKHNIVMVEPGRYRLEDHKRPTMEEMRQKAEQIKLQVNLMKYDRT